ncbi:MAG TPA: prolipoprotein diacylglyceryl transferase family protein [Bacteroidia bacterium]|nr:prolipoprotein diacylglyceryl transferase family protein [Bacteroidia bacterium]
MYPTIYDAVKDLFGLNIPFLKLLQSFGFFVAISFLLCAWVFAKELHRKEVLGLLKATTRKIIVGARASRQEMAGQFIFGFLVGWKLLSIPFSSGFSANPREYILSGDGNIFIGVACGTLFSWWRWRQAEKKRLPEPKEEIEKVSAADHVGNMTLLAALFGFLGAKIFHILENIPSFAGPNATQSFSDILISFSGLTMYGGLICGGAAVLIYARRQGFGLFHVMDACAPGLLLAYGVGRVGCQVAGDGDWGIVNTAPKPGWMSFLPNWMWSYDYPNNVNHMCNPDENNPMYQILAQINCDPDHPRLVAPVFPTPFYETVMCLVLFALLWTFRKKFKTPGLLFSVYLICNGIERFLIELIRVDTTMFYLGSFRVVQAEFIAFILFLLGVTGIFLTRKLAKKNAPTIASS